MNLDNGSKKRIIIKLTRSIDDKKSSKTEFENLFGAWEDSRSAEEIIDDIRNARTQNRKIEGFEGNIY